MAVEFGILGNVPSAGARFLEGQQAAQAEADRNMLRQMQMEQMVAQRENIMAQREQRVADVQARQAAQAQAARRQEFLSGLGSKMAEGGYKLDRPTLSSMLQFGLQNKEDSLVKLATEGLRALDEEDVYRSESARFGLPGAAAPMAAAPAAAPAAPVRQPELLAGTPFAIGATPMAAAPAAPTATAPNAMMPAATREQVQNMLLSPSARIREQGKALAGTLAKEPTDIDVMRATGFPLTKEGYAAFQATKRQPATSVTVVSGPQEKAFETELGKEQAQSLVKSRAAAEDAVQIIDTVNTGRSIMKQGMITGAGAEFLVNLNQALKTVGIDAGYADAAANSQAFAANMASNVGRVIKQFGAGTGLSNADREYAEKMAAGKITLDANAINKILEINERMARNVIKSHNKKAKGIKSNIALEVEEPAAPQAPSAAPAVNIPAGAVDFLRQNPATKAAFDAKYGAGQADRILGGR